MKNKWLPKLFGIGLLIAPTILPGYGQMTGRTSIVAVNIPFDFVVANRTLPSGQYVHAPVRVCCMPILLSLRFLVRLEAPGNGIKQTIWR